MIDKPPKKSIEGVEVSGETILGFIDAMGAFKPTALNYLKEYSISDPQAEEWYPLEPLISLFNKIADEGGRNTVKIIGATIINNRIWPDGIKTLGDALRSIDVAYHMNHRRGGICLFDYKDNKIIEGAIGHTYVIPPKKNETKALYICSSFYPCDFDFGMASAFARKFKPKGSNRYARVKHATGDCRRNGHDSCTYEIIW